ncbi:hypothetical protein NUW54_g12157 [Trametes sanguinea]|uniref:Uncharacterized protein n=1 Tax=Trametes sanguinea TaxID=158606 RepID=A0ACC1N2A2_9APHY|nr:hypothetical protein NUW54_g12157 [Trametes sanguinea]
MVMGLDLPERGDIGEGALGVGGVSLVVIFLKKEKGIAIPVVAREADDCFLKEISLDRLGVIPGSETIRDLRFSHSALKRQRDEAEHPLSLSQQKRAKKQRFEDDRRAALSEDRIVWFNDTVSYQDPPREEDYERGPAAGSTSSTTVPRSHKPSASTARPRRSVLKRTRPVKTVSYNLASWGGQAALDAGLSFFIARAPFEILGMQQARSTTQGGDGQLAGSAAPSPESLSQTRLESTLTHDGMAVPAASPALDGESKFRASDVAPRDA